MSFCGEVPDEAYGEITVEDPDGVMSGHTEAELIGASVRIGYYYNLDDGYCTAQWELWSIVDPIECGDVT